MDNTKKVPGIFGRGEGAHPKYRLNQDKAVDPKFRSPLDVSACCVYCGKACLSNKAFLYLTGLGEIVKKDGRDDNNDDLGLYPIGSDCVKLFRAAGCTIYDWNLNEI
jgi:hypothetical protein